MKHFARIIPFGQLISGLDSHLEDGYIARQVDPVSGFHLYNYTEKCTYEKVWNQYTIAARGLIVDPIAQKVVATPFLKFFNWGELGERWDALVNGSKEFSVYEKLDGSMITIYWDSRSEKWRCATRGSFNSEQAKWAQGELSERIHKSHWEKGTTYICEAIYKENKIVVNYDYEGLVVLGAYREDGEEVPRNEVCIWAASNGFRVALCLGTGELDLISLIRRSDELSKDEEGFVVRFQDGGRVKIKGAEYCRIHKLIAQMTPLSIWEALAAGDDMEAWRKELPEEMWEEFDGVVGVLLEKLSTIKLVVDAYGVSVNGIADKELGMYLNSVGRSLVPPWGRKFVWAWRKHGGWEGMWEIDKVRKALWNEIRPDGNVL